MCDAGPEMDFHFGQLIAHAAKTRHLRAGTVLGSGTVSNSGAEKHGRMDWPKGYGCIAEKRSMEVLQKSKSTTGFMQFGDTVRIEMKGKDGHSLFGAIDQNVASLYQTQADAVAEPEAAA
jgi:fumarylacetoacetate (FAA) hydrolase